MKPGTRPAYLQPRPTSSATREHISRMAEYFRLPDAPGLASSPFGSEYLTSLRLRVDSPGHGFVAVQPETSYVISYQIREVDCHSLFLGSRTFPNVRFPAGSLCFVNMEDEPNADFESAFDIMQYHIPVRCLERFGEDDSSKRINELRCPPLGTIDPVISNITTCLLPFLDAQRAQSSLFIDHMLYALQAHLAHAYGGLKQGSRRRQIGLAPWQKRRALEMLSSDSNDSTSTAEVAAQCQLSVSYFTRAFRASVGVPPHQWLTTRRIKKAKHLLQSSEWSIDRIALDCGFSHRNPFARAFKGESGLTPSLWRRSNKV